MLGLPASFWFLWCGVLVNRVGSFVLVYLTLYLTGERQLSPTAAGFVVGLYGVGAAFAGLLGGTLADRVGRRATLLLATTAGAGAMVQLGWAHHPIHIAVSTFVLGLFSELFRPAANAAVVDLVPELDRVRAFAYLYWAANLGFAAATVVGGMLSRVGFRWLFLADAGTTLLFGAVVLLAVPESRPAPRSGETPDALRPYRDRRLLRFLLAQLLLAAVFQQCSNALALDIRAHGLGDWFGWLLAINGLLIVALQPVSVVVFARSPRHLVQAAGSLLVGLGFGASALGHSVTFYAATIVVWTLGEIVFTPMTPAIIGDLAPRHLRGGYQGALHVAHSIAASAGPFVGAVVFERLGGRVLWPACFVAGGAATLIHLTSGGYERRQLEAARDALA